MRSLFAVCKKEERDFVKNAAGSRDGAGVVPLARRNLLRDRTRLLISVSGVALSVFLVLLLGGFEKGMFRQITAYLDNTPADYYVAQVGVENLQGSTSIIPREDTLQRAREVEGVISAAPVLAQHSVIELDGEKVPTFMIGYEPTEGGGPWKLSRGRGVEAADDVVLDRVLARRHGLDLGDELEIMGRSFRVVGLSDETTSWMLSLVFMRHDTAAALRQAPEATSFVLIGVDPGSEGVLDRLHGALPNADVLTRQELAANDIAYLGGIFAAPLQVMVFISLAVGALLVGLTIYSATVERVREYGVLKAMGMRNRALYAIVIRQALGATTLGFLGGIVLVVTAGRVIETQWPQFLVVVGWSSILSAAGGALAMALIAAVLPARYVGSLDPAQVFRR